MRFFKKKGKPQVDATGNLILSKNDQLVTTTGFSAGPRILANAYYIMLKGKSFRAKMSATLVAINWIWSK